MRTRFVAGKVVGAFGTLRLRPRLQLLPVPGRQRRPDGQVCSAAATSVRPSSTGVGSEFNLDGSKLEQFVAYLKQTIQRQPRRLVPQPTAGHDRDPRGDLADDRTRRHLDDPVDADRDRARDLCRMAAAQRRRRRVDDVLDVHLLGARLLARHDPAGAVRRAVAAVPDRRIRGRRQQRHRLRSAARPGPPHGPPLPDADARLHRRVHDRDALIAARHRQRGLPHNSPGRKASATSRCAVATPCRTRCFPVVSLSALNFGYVLSGAIAVEAIYSWPGIGQATLRGDPRARLPDAAGPVPPAAARSMILANLAVDLLYVVLDPRVRGR